MKGLKGVAEIENNDSKAKGLVWWNRNKTVSFNHTGER